MCCLTGYETATPLACALSVTVAGCTGVSSLDGEEPGDESTDENGVVESRYRVVVETPESDPGDGSVCEFESLPDAATDEFEAAVEGVDFETTDRGEYTSTSSPAILDADCYNVYMTYEGVLLSRRRR